MRSMALLALACLMALTSGVLAQTLTSPTADAVLGKVNGAFCEGTDNAAVKFMGIPYARPPTGSGRWTAPQPYVRPYPAKGLNALRAGAWCIQNLDSTGLDYGTQTTNENCLFLNVWAPATARPNSKLPVRFFIHGGSYLTGSGAWSQYDACQVVKDANVVVVTINYRLGALGWLALPEFHYKKGYPTNPKGPSGTTGNWGLLDMRMAMEWTKANIAAFGGDPAKVMIHGESSGGNAVFSHMMLSRSAGLFAGAISESGSPDYQNVLPLKDSYAFGELLKQSLNCTLALAIKRGYKTEKECLLKTDAKVIAETELTFPPLVMFGATLDGAEFEKSPLRLMKDGTFNKVPFIIGTNANEGMIFVAEYFQNDPSVFATRNITEKQFIAYIDDVLYIPKTFKKQVLKQYDASNYAGGWFEAAAAITLDAQFTCPSARGAFYFSKRKVPTYVYEYIQPPSSGCWLINNIQGITAETVKFVADLFNSTHTLELPSVMMVPHATSAINSGCTYTAQEKQMASLVSGIWSAMAASGKPLPPTSKTLTAPQLLSFANNATNWPLYTAKTKLGLDLNYVNPVAATWDTSEACKVWDSINERIYVKGSAFDK